MFDQPLFFRTLSRFAAALPSEYDVQQVLVELAESATAILGLAGSGITLLQDDGRLSFMTAVGSPYAEMERVQEQHQQGPCRDAVDTGQVVPVTDVRQETGRWGEYVQTARRLGVAGVAGVPRRLGNRVVGALDLYGDQPSDWCQEDLDVATVLADIASGYIVNASKVEQLEQLNGQLQQALSSRVLVEQAKGIIAEHRGITVDEAFTGMRKYARDHNTSLRAVAQSVVESGLRM
jgi:GAF domain-containing protein